eukprot:SAG11_NODE_9948_length_866_cov_6.187744_1_plen_114_part_01
MHWPLQQLLNINSEIYSSCSAVLRACSWRASALSALQLPAAAAALSLARRSKDSSVEDCRHRRCHGRVRWRGHRLRALGLHSALAEPLGSRQVRALSLLNPPARALGPRVPRPA